MAASLFSPVSALSVTSLSATSGSTAGGEELILSGTGFLASEKITHLIPDNVFSDGPAFALTDSGKIFAWGWNGCRLGTGDTLDRFTLEKFSLGDGITAASWGRVIQRKNLRL